MRESNLTLHAEQRLTQRTRLSPDQLKTLLDHGATVPVATQKGGRFAQRLVYSTVDEKWFIVVQDADDGGVLTVMPLDYVKGRLPVTAAQKRSARKRVHALENPPRPCPKPIPCPQLTVTASGGGTAAPASGFPARPFRGGWRIRVCYTLAGVTTYRNLPATSPEHGDPADWAEPGPIHHWLRDKLIEANIPLHAVACLHALRKNVAESADFLLEHLPMTREEIEACR